MPPLVAAAAVAAGGAIVGGVIASKAQGRATQAQLKANEEAIAYQKEQQRARQSRYDAAYEDYRKRYDDWLNQFFGGGAKTSTPATGDVRAASGGVPTMAASPGVIGANAPGSQGMSIADLMAGQGQIRGNAGLASGNMWGQTLGNAANSLSAAILKSDEMKPKVPPVTINGVAQPGVDQAVVAPWQPAQAQLPNQPAPWNDWSKYGATF